VLRRAAQALAAAGALGLAQPAAAQPMLLPAPGAEGRPAAPSPADASRDRAEEMRVELALLADPTTFSYAFGARAFDATVELRGFAPNEAVKAKALEIAGQHTARSVVDAIRLMPTVAAHGSVGVPVGDVQRDAALLLVQALGDKAYDIHVQARTNGTVALTGPAASLTDKWTASRCLRQLHGCSCVVNDLDAPHEAKAAPPKAAPPAKIVDNPPPKAAPPAKIVDDALPPPRPLPSTPLPGQPPQVKAPRGGHDSADVLTPPALPPGWASVPKAKPAPDAVAKSAPDPTPAPIDPKPSHSKPNATTADFASEKGSHTSLMPVPEPTPAPIHYSGPGANVVRDENQPFVTKGVAYIGDDVPEPPPLARPPAPVEVPVGAPASAPAPAPVRVPAPSVATVHLKQSIQAACGSEAREVQITTGADGSSQVRVLLAPGVPYDAVADRVLRLPQMKDGKVKLSVEVAP
jgi:osmotically-inducible protein OsmY